MKLFFILFATFVFLYLIQMAQAQHAEGQLSYVPAIQIDEGFSEENTPIYEVMPEEEDPSLWEDQVGWNDAVQANMELESDFDSHVESFSDDNEDRSYNINHNDHNLGPSNTAYWRYVGFCGKLDTSSVVSDNPEPCP